MSSPYGRKAQQWIVIATLASTACILWIDTLTSGIAKLPALVLGATLLCSLQIADRIQQGNFGFSISRIDVAIFAHVPLFVLSGWLTFNELYTSNALALALSCLVFFFAGASLFTAKDEARFLFSSLSLLTIFLCIVGVIQYFAGSYLPLNFFLGADKRVSSLLGNSNFFASYLVLMFPLTLSQALHQYSSSRRALRNFPLPATIALLLFTTQARSSFIGFGVSLVVLAALLWEKDNARRVFGVLAIAVVTFLIWTLFVDASFWVRLITMFEQGRDSTFARRVVFWVGSIHAFLGSPIAGHGLGNFEHVIQQFRSPDYWMVLSEDVVPHAHNEILEIATEYGAIGLLLLGLTFAVVIGRGISVARNGKGWERWTAAGLCSSLIAIGVDNLANVTLREAPIGVLTWFFMGLLSSQLLKKDNLRKFSLPRSIPRNFSYVPIALWACFAFFYTGRQLDKFAADSHVMNGIRYDHMQDYLAAQRELREALHLRPQHLYAHSLLSMSYLKTKQWQSAIQAVDTLQQLSPLYPKSWLVKAYALSRLQQSSKALDAIQKELKLRTHPECYDVEALIHRGTGNTIKERQALVNLLRQSIEGRTAYLMQQSCMRLIELSASDAEREEAFALFDALAQQRPDERYFFNQLRQYAGTTK